MAEGSTPPTPIQAPNWRQWTEMLIGLAAAIATVLSSFRIQSDLARALSFLLAAVIVAAVSFRTYWRAQRDRLERDRKERMENWQNLQARSAFRGLYAYSEGDVLPGETRRREAQTIATQILNPDFSFGIIAGEVGCGKTSLLQCGVAHYIREAGASLLFVRSPRQLAPVSHSDIERSTRLFFDMLRYLSIQLEQFSTQPKAIAIVDQFEEFFIESPTDHERLEIGKICQSFLAHGGRMLVAVRHDYLLDMHDLAPAIPDPISTPSLYPLKNFRIPEATQIIQECARIDNVGINSGLATTIANDLAQGGNVRPPELQVVCTALAGDLTRERYEQLGGAKGIISDYIKTAVAVCPNPHLAKMVLRALCDFDASPPAKAAPQAVGDLTNAQVARTGVTTTLSQVEQVLQILEKARITISTRAENGIFVHALVHDYLVSAVSLATTDISTRTEDANRLLSFYASAYNTDPRIRIPIGKLLQIKSDASRNLLQAQSARKMIRLSEIAAAKMFSGLLVFLVVVLIASGTRLQYQPRLLGHFIDDPNGEMLDIEHDFQPVANGKFVITGMQKRFNLYGETDYRVFSDSSTIIWEASSGQPITKLRGQRLIIDPSLVISFGEQNASMFTLDTRRIRTMDLHNREELLRYENGIAVLGQANDSTSNPLEDTTRVAPAFAPDGMTFDDTVTTDIVLAAPRLVRLRTLDVRTNESKGQLDSVPILSILAIGEQGSEIVLSTRERGSRSSLGIWKIGKHARMQDIIRLETDSSDLPFFYDEANFKIDEAQGIVVACASIYTRGIYVWSTQNGRLLHEAHLSNRSGGLGCNIEFTTQGIVIMDRQDQNGLSSLMAFLANNGRSRRNVDLGDSVYVLRGLDKNSVYLIGTMGKDTVTTLNLQSGQRQRIPGMSLPSMRTVSLDFDNVHLLTVRGRHLVQLWNLSSGANLYEATTEQNVLNAAFTLDAQGFMLFFEGNRLTFKTLNGKTVLDVTDAGGYLQYAYLNMECRRVNIWTDEGRLLQYTWGIDVPFFRFFPLRRCSKQDSAVVNRRA